MTTETKIKGQDRRVRKHQEDDLYNCCAYHSMTSAFQKLAV